MSHVERFVRFGESDFCAAAMDREAAYLDKVVGSSDRVLDVGTGIGSIEERLPDHGIVGLDVSEDMVRTARSRVDGQFVVGVPERYRSLPTASTPSSSLPRSSSSRTSKPSSPKPFVSPSRRGYRRLPPRDGATRFRADVTRIPRHRYRFERDRVPIGTIGRTVGASFAVLVAERLSAAGCEFLISVTSAGQIRVRDQPPYLVLVDRALATSDETFPYTLPFMFVIARGFWNFLGASNRTALGSLSGLAGGLLFDV